MHTTTRAIRAALSSVEFFLGAELEHVFDEPVQPIGMSRISTPPAEVLAQG